MKSNSSLMSSRPENTKKRREKVEGGKERREEEKRGGTKTRPISFISPFKRPELTLKTTKFYLLRHLRPSLYGHQVRKPSTTCTLIKPRSDNENAAASLLFMLGQSRRSASPLSVLPCRLAYLPSLSPFPPSPAASAKVRGTLIAGNNYATVESLTPTSPTLFFPPLTSA